MNRRLVADKRMNFQRLARKYQTVERQVKIMETRAKQRPLATLTADLKGESKKWGFGVRRARFVLVLL